MQSKFSPYRTLGLLTLLLLVGAAFLVPVPMRGPWVDAFFNFCHLPIFFLLGTIGAWLVPIENRLGRVAITLGCVLLVGGLIEWVQPYFGRRGSAADLIVDLCGGTLGACWFELSRLRAIGARRIAMGIGCIAAGIGVGIPLWDLWRVLGSG